MSFSLAAVGNLDDVRHQLAVIDLKYGGDLAEAARTLATEALAGVEPKAFPGQEKRFVVESSGHTDVNGTSLNLSVRTLWVSVADEGAARAAELDEHGVEHA